MKHSDEYEELSAKIFLTQQRIHDAFKVRDDTHESVWFYLDAVKNDNVRAKYREMFRAIDEAIEADAANLVALTEQRKSMQLRL